MTFENILGTFSGSNLSKNKNLRSWFLFVKCAVVKRHFWYGPSRDPWFRKRGRLGGQDLNLILLAYWTPRKASLYLAELLLLKQVKPSPKQKLIKPLTFDNFSVTDYDILAKTRSRLRTAITFFRQNDASSRARTILS